MRFLLTISFVTLLLLNSFAQSAQRRPKVAVFSTSSEWVNVKLTPASPVKVSPSGAGQAAATGSSAASPVTPANPATGTGTTIPPNGTAASPTGTPDYRPAFTGDFATNRNGWRAGNKGDYYYQIGLGKYSIRKRNTNTKQLAFTAVELPVNINLNHADFFTIKVDVLADSGQVPTGGVLFGVKDSLNYCAFTLNAKGEVSIKRIANGQTFSDYMPGDFFSPGVSVEKNRNRLSIERKGDALHFYINAAEIRSSPYSFKMLPGNGIGLTSSGYWTGFQRLSVTVGP
ncbi:hypothetical protein [Spirosoma aerophilum]